MRYLTWSVCALSLSAAVELHAQTPTPPPPGKNAREIELALSNEALQLRYYSDTQVLGQRNSSLSYGLLLTEDRDVVGSAELLIDTDFDVRRLTIRVGPQAYIGLLNQENEDVFSLAFGIDAHYEIWEKYGIAAVGHAFYAPDVLTFGSADNLRDLEVRGEIKLMTQLVAFAGYRWFELNGSSGFGDRKLQNQFFAGLRYQLR
jgi:hypothetical protein